jgi:DNA-binding transcriptional ArsR family regulator
VLRIHFTPEDIGRIRIADTPDPLWETLLSLFRFRRPGPDLVFGQWRRTALRASQPADLEMLLPLVRDVYYPDFLTPAEGVHGLDAGIEALLATPVSRLRTEVTQVAGLGGPTPSWMRWLADGDQSTLQRLAAAIRSQYAAAVAPIWPDARAVVEADRSRRARVLMDHGCDGLLRSFRPMMRWQSPVLEIDVFYEQSLHLAGRGLLLVPSYLSWGTPDVLRDTSLPPVLVYPVEHDLAFSAGTHTGKTGLTALIGLTRTSVLESIGEGRTTSELARRVGVSVASVSQHTAVLREAKLIRSSRIGQAVLHTITPLGAALLDAAGSASTD